MDWRDWFRWWRSVEQPVAMALPEQPIVVPPTPLVCPACQQEVPMLRTFGDGARLCLSCLEKS